MNVDCLRVSVTDRCNLRCIYCNPLGSDGLIARGEIMSFEEIHRVVRLCAECGIRKVRLTGGEPLVRTDIVHLVRALASLSACGNAQAGISGIEELSLTTNGVLLAPMAAELKDAGLKRVNISLDSAERRCYRRITGSDSLLRVMDGIHKAIEVGLTPVRLNCVVIRDINLSQVPSLAEMSIRLPVAVRFIEYCPTGRRTKRQPFDSGELRVEPLWYVPNSEVRKIIESRFGPLSSIVSRRDGPAVYFKVEGSAGAIGFISGRSSVFCHRCNRLRLTSDGRFRPCLYSARYYDIRKLIRSGAGDQAVAGLIRRVIREKSLYTRLTPDRNIRGLTVTAEDFSMQNIGG
jgi:cyclic pyranopterin phosphate synthase